MTTHSLTFFMNFLRRPMSIGAVAPSSPALAREMMRDVQLERDESIVEFGPGTGPFTAEIGNQQYAADQYLGIELNPHFYALLQEKFPAMNFVNASASEADQLAKDASLRPVKLILCGLPFASLPPSVQDGVMDALDRLMTPGSEFRTFQYTHAYPLPSAVRYRRHMRKRFGMEQRSQVILANLPPAYVLRWTR